MSLADAGPFPLALPTWGLTFFFLLNPIQCTPGLSSNVGAKIAVLWLERALSDARPLVRNRASSYTQTLAAHPLAA
jgi:hypothetical protein